MKKILTAVMTIALLSACMNATQHREAVQGDSAERMTVGTVQREIRVGMSGGEVAHVLGSPNILSTDEQRREVWIYDKIATDNVYSTSEGGIASLIFGPILAAGTGGLGGMSSKSGASSQSQRTLTVIIKFDESKNVRDFAYHTSRF